MNDPLPKRKNEPAVETSSWISKVVNRKSTTTIRVPLEEKQVMDIIKTIPKRCNTERVRYKVRVNGVSGRKTFSFSRYSLIAGQWKLRGTITGKIYADKNFIETRIVVKLGADNTGALTFNNKLLVRQSLHESMIAEEYPVYADVVASPISIILFVVLLLLASSLILAGHDWAFTLICLPMMLVCFLYALFNTFRTRPTFKPLPIHYYSEKVVIEDLLDFLKNQLSL